MGLHDKGFDDATLTKLSLFREYVKAWLPVWMNQRRYVSIYDFFCGPGFDSKSNPGSPAIILEEVKRYCARNKARFAGTKVRILFNDADSKHIEQLRSHLPAITCDNACCSVSTSALTFEKALGENLENIKRGDSGNLLIMDQFGVKAVTPQVVQQLANCPFTDVLFFISSSYVRRFIETPEIARIVDADASEVKTVEYKLIHRCLCRYFKGKIEREDYYLVPFSIKKNANIYGVIFGSGHLLGLEKFTEACWKIDPRTGEANYDIDGDPEVSGQLVLLPELKENKKTEVFRRELLAFIGQRKPNNHEVYLFSLSHGFSPAKARETLKSLSAVGEIEATNIMTGRPTKDYYLRWKYYNGVPPKVRFSGN